VRCDHRTTTPGSPARLVDGCMVEYLAKCSECGQLIVKRVPVSDSQLSDQYGDDGTLDKGVGRYAD